jgi:spore maturation protein CgeB
VQYLLQNEKERQAIAEAGQKRTLQNHTIYHRAEQIDTIIRENLRNG